MSIEYSEDDFNTWLDYDQIKLGGRTPSISIVSAPNTTVNSPMNQEKLSLTLSHLSKGFEIYVSCKLKKQVQNSSATFFYGTYLLRYIRKYTASRNVSPYSRIVLKPAAFFERLYKEFTNKS